MIVFDLQCVAGHRFEGWFGSSDDFGKQKSRGLVSCPDCGSADVTRVPSAIRFNSGAAEAGEKQPQTSPDAQEPATPRAAMVAKALYARVVEEILKRTEDVGREFPAEARRIHYEEAPARSIRGIASQEEHEELLDEGIPVARIPVPDSSGWN